MLTSALLLATILPFEVTPKDAIAPSLSRPVTVAAFVDSAKILGLPRLKLRDANGNRYIPNKAMLFEPAGWHGGRKDQPEKGVYTGVFETMSAIIKQSSTNPADI